MYKESSLIYHLFEVAKKSIISVYALENVGQLCGVVISGK